MSTVEDIEYQAPDQSSYSGVSRIHFQAVRAQYESGHSPHNPKSHLVWAGKWGDLCSDFPAPPEAWR